MNITYQRYWLRRGTAAEWAASNEVLYPGETGVELRGAGVPVRTKIGDGVTPWNDLAYQSESVAVPVFVQSGVVTIDGDIADCFDLALAADATLSIVNPPPAGRLLLRVSPIGGAHLTLPANVNVLGGTYTTGTTQELLEFVTLDGATFDLDLTAEAAAAEAAVSAANAASSEVAAAADATAADAAAATASAAASAAEAARDAAMVSGDIYPDTATGLAAVSEGGYFSVPSPDSSEYLILYRDVAGVATEVKRYPSAGLVATVEGRVTVVEARAQGVDYEEQLPTYTALARDSAGNVLTWMAAGKFETPAAGPILTNNIGTSLGVASDTGQLPSYLMLFKDTAGNVVTWLNNGAFDAAALGPTLAAYIKNNLFGTPVSAVTRFPAAVRNQRASSPKRQAHLWMTGDSWTERWVVPQAFSNDFVYRGATIVASGWIGVQSTGTSTSISSLKLLDGAILTTTNATISDVSEVTPTGEYGPEGLRATFAAADTSAGWTLYWKGKTLDIFNTLNGATFSHQTDAGAVNAVTLANTGLPGKTTITAASEGWHTTIITRPIGTNDLIWFGCFAGSALAGVVVSKCGNGSTTAPQVAAAAATATSAYILAQIIPTATFGSIKRETLVRMCWLTNDSRLSVTVAQFITAFEALVAAYRAADSSAEILYAIPAANAISGISSGFDIGTYIPALEVSALSRRVAIANYYARWPVWAQTPYWGGDNLHLTNTDGGDIALATYERRTFWESY